MLSDLKLSGSDALVMSANEPLRDDTVHQGTEMRQINVELAVASITASRSELQEMRSQEIIFILVIRAAL